ncbi:GATOR1 complex protein NPRL3 isoform 4-T4 [Molossus nigricans]
MGDNTSPISVILVSSGSRGNKLLFRYPFQRSQEHPASQTNKPRSRYAVNNTGDHAEDQDGDSSEPCPLTDEQLVAGFSDVILATILATKSEMCGQKFELKIDNVRFVGHPTLLQHALGQVSKTDPSPKREAPTMILFNVVFALRANADPSVINCLHNLSRRIATVLQHEERRCQYLTREAKLILALQDEVSAVADGECSWSLLPQHHRADSISRQDTNPALRIWKLRCCMMAFHAGQALPAGPGAAGHASLGRGHAEGPARILSWQANDGPQSPFHHILPKCKLARDLKEAYDSPYHALLLLSDEKSLLGELPLDCSPALVRVIKTTSAVKNLQQLAQDADLALLQVFQLAAHLVYWGKAIIIYPLCENNVYMLSPHASVCLCLASVVPSFQFWPGLAPVALSGPVLLRHLQPPGRAYTCHVYSQYSPLAEQFSHQFPSHDLPSVLAKFSLPVSLSEFRNPLAPPVQETQLIQMVVWMLQHRLLVQLHTYVCLMASPSQDEPRLREDEVPFTTRVSGRSLSTPNALSFGSPTSSDDMTLTSPSMDNSSTELLPSGDSPLNKRMTENLLASLSEHERAAILSVPAAQNPEDLRMFARLLQYFRGRHHLEEIMYNENTRRSQLLMLFDKFRSVLVVTTHEDPVIAVFQALLT